MLLFESTSDWIIALGLTMLHSLWVGFLLLGASTGLNTLLKLGASRNRYRLHLSAFFTLVILTGLIFVRLYEPVEHTVVQVPKAFAFVLGGAPAHSSWLERGSYLGAILYFTGVLLKSIHLLSSYGSTLKIKRKGKQVPGRWEDFFQQLKQKLGSGHRVRLRCSDRITSPMLVGILKPVIIVPLSMFVMLPVSQVESILSHELYHFKRYDHLVNLLQAVVEVILFYHPAIHILSARIRMEREICCDEAVLASGVPASDYARALYQLAAAREVHAVTAMAATGQKKHLKARINHIIKREHMKQKHKEKRLAVLLVVAAILLVTGLSGFGSAFSINRSYETEDEILISSPAPEPAVEEVQVVADTIRETPEAPEAPETLEALPAPEAPPSPEEDMDWESIREEMEIAREKAMKAMDEIDWESIREEMESARMEAQKAMEEIDWEEIRQEMEAAREEAMKAIDEIDWEEIRKEIELKMDSIQVYLEDFNWEDKVLNWEDMAFDLEDLEFNMEDLDIDFGQFDWSELKLDSLIHGLSMDGFRNLDF